MYGNGFVLVLSVYLCQAVSAQWKSCKTIIDTIGSVDSDKATVMGTTGQESGHMQRIVSR